MILTHHEAALATALLFSASGCFGFMPPDEGQSGLKFGPRIGVVEINGPISESKEIIRQIAQFREDGAVKAVVVRVDSPGGTVGATQEIYREVMKLREVKKVAASMGTTAASGGYYIAAAADRIFANPGTLTGSIGVIAQIADLGDLLELFKIRVATIKAGKYKDSGSMTRPLSDEERALLQEMIGEVHSSSSTTSRRGAAGSARRSSPRPTGA